MWPVFLFFIWREHWHDYIAGKRVLKWSLLCHGAFSLNSGMLINRYWSTEGWCQHKMEVMLAHAWCFPSVLLAHQVTGQLKTNRLAQGTQHTVEEFNSDPDAQILNLFLVTQLVSLEVLIAWLFPVFGHMSLVLCNLAVLTLLYIPFY